LSAARLFKSFDGSAMKARATKRHQLKVARGRIDALREKVITGAPLSDVDHRVLAKCGPALLKYIGYERRVTL
jgi:hypothetical protein